MFALPTSSADAVELTTLMLKAVAADRIAAAPTFISFSFDKIA